MEIRALSEMLKFFDSLRSRLPECGIDIIVGNHDMNLKHGRDVTSLDMFKMKFVDKNVRLHKEISVVDLLGSRAVMIPYVCV